MASFSVSLVQLILLCWHQQPAIRPLVRTGNLYHILPRPDDKVWDDVEYFDPAAKKGAVYVFRPDSPKDIETIKLKGLGARARYWLWCEDGSIAPMQITGDELVTRGFEMRLPARFSSDIVFLQDVTLGKPADLELVQTRTAPRQ